MDTAFRPKGLTALDNEIERLVHMLENTNPVDKDYITISENLKVLCEARERKNSRDISNEAILMAVVNIVGILFVLKHEQLDVITSKAFSLVRWTK
jgi:hypothetical protein